MILLVDNTYHSYNYQNPSPVKKHMYSQLLLKVVKHWASVFVGSVRSSRCPFDFCLSVRLQVLFNLHLSLSGLFSLLCTLYYRTDGA